MSCPLCERNKQSENLSDPYLIHEFQHSYLYLGEHQFFPGYCVLVLKPHFREMTDLSDPIQQQFFQEMMQVSAALQATLGADKMNMCSLGNVVEHIHWHFFPRFKTEPHFLRPPWLQMHLFENARKSADDSQQLIQQIAHYLKK